MKKDLRISALLFVIAVLLFASAVIVRAQSTITFTWNGSTDSSQLVELATIDGQPVNQGTGYAGAIQIVNGGFLYTLGLPESLLPGQGSLQCGNAITWGAKQWGTRPNGTTMDGTQAGDFYDLPGTTTCTLSSNGGVVTVMVVPFHEFIYQKICLNRGCSLYKYKREDTYLNGSGTAVIE